MHLAHHLAIAAFIGVPLASLGLVGLFVALGLLADDEPGEDASDDVDQELGPDDSDHKGAA